MHELLYPIMQGYDSVAIRSDIELGGTEQKFHPVVGRTLQEAHGQPPQMALRLPIVQASTASSACARPQGLYRRDRVRG